MSTSETTPPMSDEELTSRLVGTWRTNPGDNSGYVSTATYNADGTGIEVVHFANEEGTPDVELATEWSIEQSILHLNSLSSSDPRRIPAGLALKDRILSITDEKFEYEGFQGYGGYEGMREFKVRVE